MIPALAKIPSKLCGGNSRISAKNPAILWGLDWSHAMGKTLGPNRAVALFGEGYKSRIYMFGFALIWSTVKNIGILCL
jgi:hypothetical protein